MVLATSDNIRDIDKYATEELGIPLYELIRRAGAVVAGAVKKRVASSSSVLVFVGKGNNGADGYAAAKELLCEYDVTVYDVFGAGQKSEAGRTHLAEFVSMGGRLEMLEFDDAFYERVNACDCIIDAIFGTGFKGEIPDKIVKLAEIINAQRSSVKLAIDVPLGVNADDGSVDKRAVCSMTATVCLSFAKPGLLSYPGKTYAGELENDNISLPIDDILSKFNFNYELVDEKYATSIFPTREENSSKGTFGKVLLVTGSQTYPGAGQLTIEAALRGGVGLVTYLGESRQTETYATVFPEAIYKQRRAFCDFTEDDIRNVVSLSEKHTATLIGSGLGQSRDLLELIRALFDSDGGPIILDADAINVIASVGDGGRELIRSSRRKLILTPHPLEFARLIGASVSYVQENRLSLAKNFAHRYNCILVLKGAATVITDGEKTLINSSGSSALAKAGSGDVLAGLIASLSSWTGDYLSSAALSVYAHGAASDRLSGELSELGVTPSDLPKEIAKVLSVLTKTV